MIQTASFEALGRLKKVNAIVASLDRFARHVGLDPHRDGHQIAQMLRAWPSPRWAAVAVGCGKRPPSPATVDEIVETYRRRAA